MSDDLDADQFAILRAIRLKGMASAEVLGPLTGLADADVVRLAGDLVDAGLLKALGGTLSGWVVTPVGRQLHDERVRAELDASGQRQTVHSAYRRFLEVNYPMLELCTEWQLRDGAPNDHADADYDAGVVARLGDLHRQVQPVLDDLAAADGRFGGYRPRLEAALAKLAQGNNDFFTRPIIDSYHTVWFELHEDLLCTLGIDRGTETATSA